MHDYLASKSNEPEPNHKALKLHNKALPQKHKASNHIYKAHISFEVPCNSVYVPCSFAGVAGGVFLMLLRCLFLHGGTSKKVIAAANSCDDLCFV